MTRTRWADVPEGERCHEELCVITAESFDACKGTVGKGVIRHACFFQHAADSDLCLVHQSLDASAALANQEAAHAGEGYQDQETGGAGEGVRIAPEREEMASAHEGDARGATGEG